MRNTQVQFRRIFAGIQVANAQQVVLLRLCPPPRQIGRRDVNSGRGRIRGVGKDGRIDNFVIRATGLQHGKFVEIEGIVVVGIGVPQIFDTRDEFFGKHRRGCGGRGRGSNRSAGRASGGKGTTGSDTKSGAEGSNGITNSDPIRIIGGPNANFFVTTTVGEIIAETMGEGKEFRKDKDAVGH